MFQRASFQRASRRTAVVPDDAEACMEAALRLLDVADRSSGDMRERLVARGYLASVVEGVLARLIELGLINDQAYAERLVQHAVQRRLGKRGAFDALMRKSVERELAQSVVDAAEERGVFAEAALALARSSAAKTQGLDREVRLRRFWAAGGRKGHSVQDLRRAEQEVFSATADE